MGNARRGRKSADAGKLSAVVTVSRTVMNIPTKPRKDPARRRVPGTTLRPQRRRHHADRGRSGCTYIRSRLAKQLKPAAKVVIGSSLSARSAFAGRHVPQGFDQLRV